MNEKELRKVFMNEERTVNTMINLLSQEEEQNIWREASEVTRKKTWKEASQATRSEDMALIAWLFENGRTADAKRAAVSSEEFNRLYNEMEEFHSQQEK